MSIILSKSREEFIKGYRKHRTRHQAEVAFVAWDRFLKHIHTTEPDLFLQFREWQESKDQKEQLQVYATLNHMTFEYFPRKKFRSTIINYFSFIKLWIEDQGITLEERLLKKLIKFPEQLRERPIPLTGDMFERILKESNNMYKGIWLLQGSSGMRIQQETLNMRPSWINTKMNPPMITIPAQFSKNGIARVTFMTNEAWEYVEGPYNDAKKTDSIIYPISYDAVRKYFRRVCAKLGYDQKMINNKFHHIRIHKFRKYAHTNISNSVIPGQDPGEFAHAILGHEKYLMTYFETPDDQMAEMYRNAMPRLTINKSARLKDENTQLKDKLNEIENVKRENKSLWARLKRLEDMKS